MKKSLLLFLMFATSLLGVAQADRYNKSVFADFKFLQPGKNLAAKNRQQWESKLPQWSTDADRFSGIPADIYGPAVNVQGSDIQAKAQYCISNIIPALGITNNGWQQTGINNSPRNIFARYQQSFAGHKVAFSNLTLCFTTNSKLLRIMNNSYGEANVSLMPVISKEDAALSASQNLQGAIIADKTIAADWEWFPVPVNGAYELHPAWNFTITGTSENKMEMLLTGYVDALTGDLLYRNNEVRENLDFTTKGNVYKDGTLSPATLEALPNLSITINSTVYYTNDTGLLSVAALNVPATATVSLQGKWSKVTTNSTGTTVPSFTYNVASNGTIYTFPATTPSSIRHVNAYYHVNRVHNFMKGFFTAFTGMDFSLPTKVDVTSSTCNAYYSNGTINFYAAGGGCNSFAEIGDIIYHEYGHGISDKFYVAQGVPSMVNGALNEGSSDVWAMSISHNPILGQNAYTGSANNYIRRYDQAPKVYPFDIKGEVHADGEIIAGAWWDVAVNTGSPDTMARLFTSNYFFTPDGPTGTEGIVYHKVLINALLCDDNDANLNNGTPHFAQIVAAFAKHGIYLLSGAIITHTELAHQPSNTTIPVSATIAFADSTLHLFQGAKLFYKKRGNPSSWDSVAMTAATPGGSTYNANIPAQTKGSILDYYFALYDISGTASSFAPDGYNPTSASNQSNIPYQFGVGINVKNSTDFENTVSGWSIGSNPGDDATASGRWIQAIPVPSSYTSAAGSLPCQTGQDHTSGGGKCLVTGNGASPTSSVNSADVDSGITTVITPVFDVSNYTNPIIEYYRWFSNDRGANARTDNWQTQIRDSGGIWILSVENTFQSDYHWRRRIFGVKEYLPASKYIQMRFIAADRLISSYQNYAQSTVEAAMDDFFIYDEELGSGISESKPEMAKIYPNPSDELVKIVLREISNAGSITLYDLTGRQITTLSINSNQNEYILNTKLYPSGSYMLIIQNGKTIQSHKLSIVH